MKINSLKNIKKDLLESFGHYKDDPFEFAFIENYCRKKSKAESTQILSDKTCNDLDFQELFMSIDRTNSRVGQQYLYNQLRTISHESTEISRMKS